MTKKKHSEYTTALTEGTKITDFTVTDGTSYDPANTIIPYVGIDNPTTDYPIATVPVDLNKVKTFEELKQIMIQSDHQFWLYDTKEAYKYATDEWLKKNAHKTSPLGQVLNSNEDES